MGTFAVTKYSRQIPAWCCQPVRTTKRRATRQPPASKPQTSCHILWPSCEPLGPTSSARSLPREMRRLCWDTKTTTQNSKLKLKTQNTWYCAAPALALWLLRGGTGSSICRLPTDFAMLVSPTMAALWLGLKRRRDTRCRPRDAHMYGFTVHWHHPLRSTASVSRFLLTILTIAV